MYILGLDLSLCNTGWVLLDCLTRYVRDSGVIKSKRKGVERLSDIQYGINILSIDYDEISCAVIEGYAFAPRFGMTSSIGELGGVVKIALYDRRMPFYVVAPTTLKKFVSGGGKCSKKDMKKHIVDRWGVELKTEHEYDAYGLARMGISLIGGKDDLNAPQKEAVAVVKKDKSKSNYIKEVI